MPIDTFMAYTGVYGNVDDAIADYEFIKDLHTEAGLIDAFDAAVIERKGTKTKIVKKHETPTRAGGALGAGVGLASGLVVALFPFHGDRRRAPGRNGGRRRRHGSGRRSRGGRHEPERSEGAGRPASNSGTIPREARTVWIRCLLARRR